MTPSYNVANFASEADYHKAHQQASHEQIDLYPDSFDSLMSQSHKRMYEKGKPNWVHIALQYDFLTIHKKQMTRTQLDNICIQSYMMYVKCGRADVESLREQVRTNKILSKPEIKKLFNTDTLMSREERLAMCDALAVEEGR